MAIECCYNCKNYTEECLKQNCDKCDKYGKKAERIKYFNLVKLKEEYTWNGKINSFC